MSRLERLPGWAVLLFCAYVCWLGLRAFDHPSTWPTPATAEQREALTDR